MSTLLVLLLGVVAACNVVQLVLLGQMIEASRRARARLAEVEARVARDRKDLEHSLAQAAKAEATLREAAARTRRVAQGMARGAAAALDAAQLGGGLSTLRSGFWVRSVRLALAVLRTVRRE